MRPRARARRGAVATTVAAVRAAVDASRRLPTSYRRIALLPVLALCALGACVGLADAGPALGARRRLLDAVATPVPVRASAKAATRPVRSSRLSLSFFVPRVAVLKWQRPALSFPLSPARPSRPASLPLPAAASLRDARPASPRPTHRSLPAAATHLSRSRRSSPRDVPSPTRLPRVSAAPKPRSRAARRRDRGSIPTPTPSSTSSRGRATASRAPVASASRAPTAYPAPNDRRPPRPTPCGASPAKPRFTSKRGGALRGW